MQIIKGNFQTSVYLITGSVILDGFDGTVARLTKTESNFGVQLDSLVDAVSFGVVSSVLIYIWGFQDSYLQVGKIVGFIFLSAGIIRLARFNVMKEAEAYVANVFVGLPIPLGALSIASLVLIIQKPLVETLHIFAFSLYVILVAFLMISTVKYRTMKRIKSKNNLLILFFLAIIIASGIIFPNYTIPTVSLAYLISPIFFYSWEKIRKPKHPHPLQTQTHSPTPPAPVTTTTPETPGSPVPDSNRENA
ncbi:MAG: CDP-diacylglycerol--serine O-phosphatidyltransferase [bacterium]|nr:CDP-diacylglycerol--serine O-phosphatidyltransferase [bacterium]